MVMLHWINTRGVANINAEPIIIMNQILQQPSIRYVKVKSNDFATEKI